MSRDAMITSHPIEVIVHHPDEVDEIFDDISYAKVSGSKNIVLPMYHHNHIHLLKSLILKLSLPCVGSLPYSNAVHRFGTTGV